MPERQQLSEVSRVKNNVHGLIHDPIKVAPDQLIGDVLALIEKKHFAFSTFPVVDSHGKLVGLLPGHVVKHRYAKRKVNEALVQGVETARAVLTTTPQGQAVDAQFVKWLMDHQKEAGVFTTVSGLVEQLSDNPAARLTAQEIAQRVQQAQSQRTVNQTAVAAN